MNPEVETCIAELRAGAAFSVYIASGLGLAKRILSENVSVARLVVAMREDTDAPASVVRELLALAADGGDPTYAHQHDPAMLALLYALDTVAVPVEGFSPRGPWPEAVNRASWTRGFASAMLNNGRWTLVQHSEGRTTMTTINSDTSLSECGFSETTMGALSSLGLGPDAAVNALTTIDAKTAAVKKTVLRELQTAAVAAGLSLLNADGLVRKTREPKAPTETTEFPSSAKVVSLTLSDEDGVTVVVEGGGHRFEYVETIEGAAALRLGDVGKIAFVPNVR